jgi:hypothetical protein
MCKDTSTTAATVETANRNLHPYDVICGRTKCAFNNVGNRRMRFTVTIALGDFLEARSRRDKSAVIESVLRTIEGSGGTFLKWCNKEKTFLAIVRKKAHEKIGHAFRDMVLTRGRAVITAKLERPTDCTSDHALLAQPEQYKLPEAVEVASSAHTISKELLEDVQPSRIPLTRDEVGAGAALPDFFPSEGFGPPSQRQAFPRQVSLLEEDEFDCDFFLSRCFFVESPDPTFLQLGGG